MRYVDIDGVRLSVIGLGTWQFGSREWGYGTDYAEREAGEILARALDLGINLIDTAEIYAFGRSERIVGRGIAGRRKEAFVATKVFPVLPIAPVVEQRGRASARRLGVDTIDLYQVHWPNPVVPIRMAMEGMRSLRRDGVVDHVGVSNFSLAQWKEAEERLGGRVLSNQVQYSLVRRQPEADLIPFAAERGRVVIAYSPLAQGFLSARHGPGARPGGMRAVNPLFSATSLERAQPLFDTLRRVAAAHGAKPAQVALAWAVRHPNVVAIPGASSVSQLESNVEAADLELTADQVAELGEAADAFSPDPGRATRLLRRR
ncbi:MAG TPA: aldo/keto reductase [Acidimicrobiales bacterium]|nr:aldo/keto reductase [Acidimicrobiales bacterium]